MADEFLHVGRAALAPIVIRLAQPANPDVQIGVVVVTSSVGVAFGVLQELQKFLLGLVELQFNGVDHRHSLPRV